MENQNSQTPPAGPAGAAPQADSIFVEQKLKLANQLKSGASWFYWIAGLSLVNTAIFIFGGQWNFIMGLGITQVIDAVAKEAGGSLAVKAVAVVMDLLIAGMFAGFGVMAAKRKNWAFVTGMIIYGLDALIFIMAKDYLGIAFHGLALWFIFGGMKAMRQLAQLEPAVLPGAQIKR